MARRFGWLWALIAVIGIAVAFGWFTNQPPAAPAPTSTVTAMATVASATAAVTPTAAASEATPHQAATAPPPATSAPNAAANPGGLGMLDAYFLDVDQGDSILLKGPDFTILIDTGRRERSEVVPYLEAIGVESIDLLVGTHPHADHIGQFPQVLARFPVREVWLSGDTATTLIFENALDAIAKSGAGYHEPRTGEVYDIGAAHIEVVNPTKLTGDVNAGSVAFRLVFGDVAFMFTGDAEAPTEQAMIATGLDLHAQILKLGHHGSNTSSSLAFLQAVHPDIAIWSAGIDNTYGHPSPATLQRLHDLGITAYGTAVDGTIVIETDGKTFRKIPYAPHAPITHCAPNQININTATAKELEDISQIGPARAQSLISLRPFGSVDDMVRIPGITAKALEKIKGQGLACVE